MGEPEMTTRELLAAMNPGTVRFAWLPTRLYLPGGHFRDGWAWLCPVRYLRCIGFPRYYYARIPTGGRDG